MSVNYEASPIIPLRYPHQKDNLKVKEKRQHLYLKRVLCCVKYAKSTEKLCQTLTCVIVVGFPVLYMILSFTTPQFSPAPSHPHHVYRKPSATSSTKTSPPSTSPPSNSPQSTSPQSTSPLSTSPPSTSPPSTSPQSPPTTCLSSGTCGSGECSTGQKLQVVNILVNGGNKEVLCDTQTGGGNWIVMQRRTDGVTEFYRDWAHYVSGFGDVTDITDHWVGLQDIHYLCPSTKSCALRVDLMDDDNRDPSLKARLLHAQYNSFSLEDSSANYKLHLSGYMSSSTAGDALTGGHSLDGMMFSTFDRDNDQAFANCARIFHSGWWFSGCTHSNLNGRWGNKSSAGLIWKSPPLASSVYPTFTEMKIRVG